MPPHIRLEVYEAMADYLESGEVPELKPRAQMVFDILRPLLEEMKISDKPARPVQMEFSFVSDNETEREEIPFEEIESTWKSICVPVGLPVPRLLSAQRRAKLRVRWGQWRQSGNPLDVFRKTCQTISQTPFLCGENATNWKATFDWVIQNDRNWLKILEGNYEKSNTCNYGIDTSARRFIAGSTNPVLARKSCI